MRMRHVQRLVSLLPAVALLAMASPARAGGWNSLTFRRDYYLVGRVAEARQQFFAGKLEGTGSLEAGPYYANLLVDSRGEGFDMIDPPKVPDGAIRLGALGLQGPVVHADGYPYGVASLWFRVPDVPSGRYSIGFCDDPCVHSTVGWLAWGTITIAHTPYEGRLIGKLAEAKDRASSLAYRARKSERAANQLQQSLAETRAALAGARAALKNAEEEGLPPSAAADMSSRGEDGSPVWPVAAIVIGVLLAGAAFAGGTLVGSRRAQRLPASVPHTPLARERKRVGA